jgi:Cu+-exporting ATPase
MGSRGWLESHGVAAADGTAPQGSIVHVAIDGVPRGWFVLESALRHNVDAVISQLAPDYELTLLSGDNAKQRGTFSPLFGERTQFNQSPLDKLEFIHGLQRAGKRVLMVGDGLNDSGALRQSDVGVAVVENISAFSPASDVIMSAAMVPQLDAVLRFAKHATRIVRLSFVLSSLYNVIGISIAASGLLAPIVCAILMPISSVSVVAFACGATAWSARRDFRGRANLGATAAMRGEPPERA